MVEKEGRDLLFQTRLGQQGVTFDSLPRSAGEDAFEVMKASDGSDLFDHHAIMDADFSSVGGDHDFEFAFNSSNFSDRVLRIEIMADPPESKSDGEACSSIAEWRKRKRRREEIKRDEGFMHFKSSC